MNKHLKNIAELCIFLLIWIIQFNLFMIVYNSTFLAVFFATLIAFLVPYNIFTFKFSDLKHAIRFYAFYAVLEFAMGGFLTYIKFITEAGNKTLRTDIRHELALYIALSCSAYYAILFLTTAINFYIRNNNENVSEISDENNVITPNESNNDQISNSLINNEITSNNTEITSNGSNNDQISITDQIEEILKSEDYKNGLVSGKDIATKFNVSPVRVSRIKSKMSS